jgi:hypothetical protein
VCSRRGGIGISVGPGGKAWGVNDSQVIYRLSCRAVGAGHVARRPRLGSTAPR